MKFQVSKFLIRSITTSDLIFRSRASKKWMACEVFSQFTRRKIFSDYSDLCMSKIFNFLEIDNL